MDIQIFCFRLRAWKSYPEEIEVLAEFPRPFRLGLALLAPFSGAWVQSVVVSSYADCFGLAIVHPWGEGQAYPPVEHWRWVLAAYDLAEHPGFSRPAPIDLDNIPF